MILTGIIILFAGIIGVLVYKKKLSAGWAVLTQCIVFFILAYFSFVFVSPAVSELFPGHFQGFFDWRYLVSELPLSLLTALNYLATCLLGDGLRQRPFSIGKGRALSALGIMIVIPFIPAIIIFVFVVAISV